jgi:hypothetical protein
MDAIMKLERSLQAKSLDALMAVAGEDAFLVMDHSGSMKEKLRNGKRRIDALGEVVADIKSGGCDPQMVAFAGNYWDGGNCFMVAEPQAECGGGTPMGEAIEFAKANGATRIVMISDGVPCDREHAMRAAMDFGGRIDVVFVGNPGESGSAFLNKLAAATGGTRFNGDLTETKKLSAAIAGLLTA